MTVVVETIVDAVEIADEVKVGFVLMNQVSQTTKLQTLSKNVKWLALKITVVATQAILAALVLKSIILTFQAT
ncbi:hypothetical protein D3C87_2146710 [compost metagenome]